MTSPEDSERFLLYQEEAEENSGIENGTYCTLGISGNVIEVTKDSEKSQSNNKNRNQKQGDICDGIRKQKKSENLSSVDDLISIFGAVSVKDKKSNRRLVNGRKLKIKV